MKLAGILRSAFLGVAVVAAPASSDESAGNLHPTDDARDAEIIFLGEQHDNPVHHEVQAAWVAALKPKAIVFEMLTTDQASRVDAEVRRDAAALENALEWEQAGWPDFDMYFPIFAASPDAIIVGAAVPREAARAVLGDGLAQVFGVDNAERFGLVQDLPDAELSARIALQGVAHCDAMPEEMLPMMVDIQRLRDATLAKASLEALVKYGAPVVVITGNGHARQDWGAPFLVTLANPDVSVFALGQGEAGAVPDGGFDAVADGPAVERGDPCDTFR